MDRRNFIGAGATFLGAAAVSVITKSGSNEIHGQLYEYLRNNRTDASNYFNNLNNAAKNPIHTNQFGAAAGGPIIKNKLFVFGAYEGLRFRQSVLGDEALYN